MGSTHNLRREMVGMQKAGKFVVGIVPQGVAGSISGRANPEARGVRKASSITPKRKGTKTSSSRISRKSISKADRRVTCSICGMRTHFRNLAKHKAKAHPEAAHRAGKKAAQKRLERMRAQGWTPKGEVPVKNLSSSPKSNVEEMVRIMKMLKGDK